MTTVGTSAVFNLCWKHDVAAKNFYKERYHLDGKNVKKEIMKIVKDTVYQGNNYWVLKIVNGYEIYRTDSTYSTRISQIGYTGQKGLNKAIRECERRELENEKRKNHE